MSIDFRNLREYQIGAAGRLFIAPVRAKDIVAIEGSVLGGPNMLPSDKDVIAGLAAELLDAGTKRKGKAAVRESLAARGAILSFSAGGDRTYFSAQCFPEDLPFLLDLIRECLGEANFPEAEVKNVKSRALGELIEERANTRAQAERAFSQLLYDPKHVNYVRPLDDEEASVKQAKRPDLAAFGSRLGKHGLVLAITGDVGEAFARKAAEQAFARFKDGTEEATTKKNNEKKPNPTEKLIPIEDKANIDVLLGASLPLTKYDPSYHAFAVVSEMLGGGFAGHLMQTIRERDGLTYGVYTQLAGFADGADGCFKVWATFSPELYEKSVDALRKEIRWFFKHGLTKDALLKKKDEITGSYVIGLSTTRGLAKVLHQIGIDGRALSYLSEYPAIIRAISLSDIASASTLIPLDRLSLAASGTFPKK